jgi:hypothetical protein
MTQAAPTLGCSACDKPVDCCEFCDRTDCPTAICYRCLGVALRQATRDLHDHGG